jgi:NADPH-ferrihemoprotein reductase
VRWLGDADVPPFATYPAGVASATAAMDSASSAYLAPLGARKLLTDPASDRKVWHLEFDLTGADATKCAYEPGDAIGVAPENDAATVEALAKRLGVRLDAAFELAWIPPADSDSEGAPSRRGEGGSGSGSVGGSPAPPLPHVRCPATVRDALTHAVDLTGTVRKSFLRVLAEYCADPRERIDLLHLSSRGGKAAYASRIAAEAPTVLELLTTTARSCALPFAAFLDAAQPLQPRMYSITSAPEASPGRPSVAFSVVRGVSPAGAARRGVATNWLDAALEAGDESFRAPVFLKRSTTFAPPGDARAPVLMIGPGTGVAPFRGFLQRREARLREAAGEDAAAAGALGDAKNENENENENARGKWWLFFGCRAPEEDYLYREDLERFVRDGTLDELTVAFSRVQSRSGGGSSQQGKRYVQHEMAERAAEVAALVESSEDSRVYVCGDGGGMARDVHAALVDALAKHTFAGDEAKAAEKLAEMTKQGRYVRDIWS